MYQTILKKMAAQAKEYDTKLQPPCTEKSLRHLQSRAWEELAIDVPVQYLEFLRQNNGFDLNGLLVYASETVAVPAGDENVIEGFVEANLAHRDYGQMSKFLVFGESGDEIYVYNLETNDYQIIDSVSLDVFHSFSTFDELITEALESHL